MAKHIPFFEMFAELQLSGELRLKLAGAMLTGAVIDRERLSMALQVTVQSPLSETDIEDLGQVIKTIYGFQSVELAVTCKAPEMPRPSATQPTGPVSSGGGKREGTKVSKILMGKAVKTRPGPMGDLNLKMGTATVAGKVFSFECRETRRPGMWRLSFDMTDYTNSVTVQKSLTTREAQQLESAISPGMWLCVQGKMEPTWDGKDIQLSPYHINVISMRSGRTPPR